MPPVRRPIMERLLARIVVDSNGCWIWQGAKDGYGYGKIGSGGKYGGMVYTHRVTYQDRYGETDSRLDHLCRVTSCCNPDHLEPVTQGENVRRGDHCYRDDGRPRVCPRGHRVTPDSKTKDGRCRPCRLQWRRDDYRRRNGEVVTTP